MKRLLFLALLFPATIFAQNEFGYHATWYFSYGGYGEFGYKKVSHVRDTTMHGMNWLKFEVTGFEAMKTGPNSGDYRIVDSNKVYPSLFLATRNDSVFRVSNNSPYLLYDFNAQVGDRWQFAPIDTSMGCDSVPVATVREVGYDTLDGQVVRFMEIDFPMDTVKYGGTPNYQPMCGKLMNSRVYPDFGSLSSVYLFRPRPNACDGSILDFYVGHSFNCFTNDSISINFTNQACDFVPFISVKEYETISFEVYPNPTNGLVNIQTEEKVSKVEIYSLDGQKLLETIQTENIELPASSGMYVLAIYFEDGERVVTKVVRE